MKPGYIIIGGLVLGLCGCQVANQPEVSPRESAATDYVDGALAYHQGDKDRALEALRRSIVEDPDLIMARVLLGSIFKEKELYAQAAEQFERAAELDPYTWVNHYNLGLMQHLLARLKEASKSYLRSIELNPEDAKSNMNLGLVYAALGEPEKGLPYCQKAVELNPDNADAQSNLGVVMQSTGLLPESERHYRIALEQDSSRVETAINLAGNLLAQKRGDEAISLYQNILKTKNTSLVRQRYGAALLQSGKLTEAIVELQLAIQMDAKNSAAYASLGDAWISQYRDGSMIDEVKRKKALESWKRSLELNAKQPAVTALIKEYTNPTLYP